MVRIPGGRLAMVAFHLSMCPLMSMRTTEVRVAFHALIRLERSLSFGGGRGECWQRGGGQVAGELSVGALLCWFFAGLGGGLKVLI